MSWLDCILNKIARSIIMKITQKRSSKHINFTFYDTYFNYHAEDKNDEKDLYIHYSELTDKTSEIVDKIVWYDRAGIFWCFLGIIQIGHAVYLDLPLTGKGFWLGVGLLSLLVGRFTKVKYTKVETKFGFFHILHDKNYDAILHELQTRRNLIKEDAGDKEDDVEVQKQTIWNGVINAASAITNNVTEVLDFFKLAQKDPNPTDDDSKFWNKASITFDNRFREPDEVDGSDPTAVPCVIFKTIMEGFGFMESFDWKEIYAPEMLIEKTNSVLTKLSLDTISQQENDDMNKGVKEAGDDPELISHTNVTKLEKIIGDRGHKALWFDEGGDSFMLFIVKPGVYDSLVSTELDEIHSFTMQPY